MTPTRVVDRLEVVIGIHGSPCRLVQAIERELISFFGLVAIQAAERSEDLFPGVGRQIAERAQRAELEGKLATLVMLGTGSDIVAGSSYVLSSDPLDVVQTKKKRLQVGSVVSAMRDLSFEEFERFCARILEEVGATNPQVTRRRSDQGIDFYGHLSLGRWNNILGHDHRLIQDIIVLFAGQAKHYPGRPIGPDVVRELIGAVTLARTRTFTRANIELFENIDLKIMSPLVVFLFTTGSFSQEAMQLAREAGVFARSGEQLAVFLADKGVGMLNVGEDVHFSIDEFRHWLGK